MTSRFPDDKKLQELIDSKLNAERIAINVTKESITNKILDSLQLINNFPIRVHVNLFSDWDLIAWDEVEAETKAHPPWKKFVMERKMHKKGDYVDPEASIHYGELVISNPT